MYLICKLLFTALLALLSSIPVYLPLYYRDVLNFSSNEIGFLLAIAPFIHTIACPIWSYVVDKRPWFHGPIMAATTFIGGASVMATLVIGHTVSTTKELPQTFHAMSYVLSHTELVSVVSVLSLVYAFFTSPNVSLVDSAVMKILGPNKILYGEQRLWGSISSGLTILISGQLLSWTGTFDSIFYLFAACSLCFILFACVTNVQQQELVVPTLMPVISSRSEKLLAGRVPTNYASIEGQSLYKPISIASVREEADETLDAIGHVSLGLSLSRIASVDQAVGLIELPSAIHVLKSVRVATFLVTAFMFGAVHSLMRNFTFLFLSRDLLVPASWIGWTGPTSGIGELLCFCFSKQFTKKYGMAKMILAAHVVAAVRCLCYTVLSPDSIWTNINALLLQSLQGVGFGIYWAAAVNEMDSYFPPEQRAVAQGIIGAAFVGLGAGMGAVAGGFIYQYLGAISMYQITALTTVLSISIFYIGRLDKFK